MGDGIKEVWRVILIDRILLHVPVLGDVLRKSAVSRFTRTLGTLISSGASILDGLGITARTSGDRVVQDAIMGSRASIAGGETIAAPLQKSQVFPPMVISMIAVGEQTGGLDEMLARNADFYDDEVDATVSALLSLLVPIMIVFPGVVAGGMKLQGTLRPLPDVQQMLHLTGRGSGPAYHSNRSHGRSAGRTAGSWVEFLDDHRPFARRRTD